MVDRESRDPDGHNAERRNRTAPEACMEQLPTNPSEESSRRVSGQQPQCPPVVLWPTVKEWYQNYWVPKHSAAQLTLRSHLSHQSEQASEGSTAPQEVSSANPRYAWEESTEEHLDRVATCLLTTYTQWNEVCRIVDGVSNSYDQGHDGAEPIELHLQTNPSETNFSRMVPGQQPQSPRVINTDSGTKFVNCEAHDVKEVVQRLTGKDWVQKDGVQEHSAGKFTRPSHSSHQQLVRAQQKHYQGHLLVSLRATKRRARLSRMALSYEGHLLVSLRATKKRARNSRMASMESVVGLGQRKVFLRQPKLLKSIGSSLLEQQGTVYVPFDLGEICDVASTSRSSCAACIFFKKKCPPGCMFAPYLPPDQPLKFANFHKTVGHAIDCAKLYEGAPSHQCEDASFIDAAPLTSLSYASVRDISTP